MNEKGKEIRKRSQKEIIFYFDGSDFSQLAVQPYESIRNLYEDPQVVRDIQSTLGDLFLYSFERHGQAEEYEFEELEEIDIHSLIYQNLPPQPKAL